MQSTEELTLIKVTTTHKEITVHLDLDEQSAKVLMCVLGDSGRAKAKDSIRNSSAVKNKDKLCAFTEESNPTGNLYDQLHDFLNEEE